MLNSLKNLMLKWLFTHHAKKPFSKSSTGGHSILSRKKLLARANELVQIGNFAEAACLYKDLIAIEKTSLAAHVGLGFTQLKTGDLLSAIKNLNFANSLDPQNADVYYMLGVAHNGTGDVEKSEYSYDKAYNLAPGLEHLYCDFCLALFNQGKIIKATALMNNGIMLYPHNADFHFFLGNLLAEAGDYAAATKSYANAMRIGFPTPHLISNFATALRQIGQLQKANQLTAQAIELAPDIPSIFSNHLLGLQYSDAFSRHERFEQHLAFAKQFETPLIKEWGNYLNSTEEGRVLKIGYVSGDFRNHSLAFFIEPIIERHNRAKFDIYCYYSHPMADDVSSRFKRLADHWVPCSNLSDQALASRIRSDAIDILIDLSGHTGHNRMLTFARKPAPVQMTWLGYQSTTGLSAIDFRITEESLDPIGATERFHSEQLLRLPSSGTFNPASISPVVNLLPALARKTFTFACLNNPSKITDEMIALWAKILNASPISRLIIGNSTFDVETTFIRKFGFYQVSSNQLYFIPKMPLKDYLQTHHQIDLALDTFPYNGGTTTFHSLWMGVPIIAMHGDTALSKVGASVMTGLGFPQFCAATEKEYVERALYFLNNHEELNAVRMSLRDKMQQTIDVLNETVTTSLETALESCWAGYREDALKTTSGFRVAQG